MHPKSSVGLWAWGGGLQGDRNPMGERSWGGGIPGGSISASPPSSGCPRCLGAVMTTFHLIFVLLASNSRSLVSTCVLPLTRGSL